MTHGEGEGASLLGAWRSLQGDVQLRICTRMASLRTMEGIGEHLVRTVARRFNFRISTVLRCPPERFGKQLLHSFMRFDEGFINNLFVLLYNGPEIALLSDVYDAIGAPHRDGELTEEVRTAELPDRDCASIAENLVAQHGPDACRMLFEVFRRNCSEAWRPTVETILRDISSREFVSGNSTPGPHEVPLSKEGASAPVIRPSGEKAGVLEAAEFTALDRAIIKATVAAHRNIEGAPSLDEIDDLIQELLELNESRHKSQFHRGFFDALLHQEIATGGPASNPERRAWYLAGYFIGRLRKEQLPVLRPELEGLREFDRAAIRNGSPGSRMLAQLLVVPLLQSQDLEEALGWLRIASMEPSQELIHGVLEWSAGALRSLHPEAALAVLQTLENGLLRSQSRVPSRLGRWVHRQLGVAMRQMGRATEAESVVDDLLSDCVDDHERALLYGEKILLALSLKKVEDLAVHEDAMRGSLFASIANARAVIHEGLENKVDVPLAMVAAALPFVAPGDIDADESQEASALLLGAITAMLHANSFWSATGLLVKARAYLGILELRTLDASLAASGTSRLVESTQEGLHLPLDLLHEAISNAVLQDAPRSAELATLILDRDPRAIIQGLDVESLAVRSQNFRNRIVDMLEDGLERLTADEKFNVARQLVQASARPEVRDRDVASRALDALEVLARQNDHVADLMINVLQDEDRWSYAWEQDDRDFSLLGLLRRRGRTEEELPLLLGMAHRAISEGDHVAADLVDDFEHGGGNDISVKQLRARLDGNDVSPRISATRSGPARRVSVMFVGGNEAQANYDSKLRAEYEEREIDVDIQFEHTGWSSNWGALLGRMEQRLRGVDAIVLMRFVRTEFGKKVRKIASEAEIPWVACTGHGLASIRRAIDRAIHLAGR